MIEVVVSPTGDSAEAETPSDAVCAASVLLTEARENGSGAPRAAFYVAGRLVRCDVSLRDLEGDPLA